MRYTQLYNQVKEATPDPHVTEAQLNRTGWDALRRAMDRLDRFVPTDYPLINALVAAHSPVIKYDATSMPQTIYEKITGAHWIRLPPPAAFASPDAYARVLVHELSHWVKWVDPAIRFDKLDVLRDAKELPPLSDEDRFLLVSFGMEPQGPYALEELTAETTAYLVVSKLAPEIPLQPMVDYLSIWGENLKEAGYGQVAIDKLYTIAQEQAHDAASYLLAPLNLTPED